MPRAGKPCLLVQLDDPGHPGPEDVLAWIAAHQIRVLNVAGPRESKRAGVYEAVRRFLAGVLVMECLADAGGDELESDA